MTTDTRVLIRAITMVTSGRTMMSSLAEGITEEGTTCMGITLGRAGSMEAVFAEGDSTEAADSTVGVVGVGEAADNRRVHFFS